jgi:hypothetical protein
MKQAHTPALVLVAFLLSFPSVSAAGDPPDGPSTPRRAITAAIGPTAVQSSSAPAASPFAWLTDYRFHLSAAAIRFDDPRFDWEAHFGGDVDLLDYRVGRLNLLADYAVIIGSEFRTIDPNQGAYHLAVSASLRSGPSELQAVFRHVSRHLSDRANHTSVSWNAAGVAATARCPGGKTMTTVTVYGAKVVQAAFVDYTWQFGAGVDTAHPLSSAVALVARGDLASILVNRSIAGRNTQTAGKLEAGVRLRGKGAAVELFAAWERRVDPYPLERAVGSWALLGFRLISR